MQWIIRDAVPEDQAALRELRRRSSLSNEGDRDLLLAHPEALDLPAELTDPGRTRVAVAGDRIIGWASTLPGDGAVELDGLFVDPDSMRQGVGRALVLDVAARASAADASSIEVTGNDHAFDFYERTGFTTIGMVDTPLGVPARRLRRPLAR